MFKESISRFYSLFGVTDEEIKGHNKSLDGLRGIAVLFVLLSHSSNMNMHLMPFIRFEHTGKAGVYLFFLLSAFLLDKQIYVKFKERKADKKYWYNYTLKRIIRIYPAYIIAIFSYWVLDAFLSKFSIEGFFESPMAVFNHLILVEGQGHFWSIPTEMKYYLLSPVIMFILYSVFRFDRRKSSIFILLLVLIATLCEFYYGLPYMSAFRYFPIFLVGMWLAIYSGELLSVVSLKLINILSLVSIFILVLTMPFYFNFLTGAAFDYRASYLFLPYTLLWGVVLLGVLKGSIIKKVFELRFLRLIGVISFSVYLYHWPFLVLIRNLSFLPLVAKGSLAVVLSLIVGALMYLLVDRTLQRNRKRFLIN